MKNLLSILFLSQVLNTALFAGLEIKNLETLKKTYGLQNVGNQRNLTRLKIAIIDNGLPNPKLGTIQLGKDVPLNTIIYDYTSQKQEEYIKRFPVQIRENVRFYSPELLKQIKSIIPDGEELTFDETDHLRRMAKIVYSLTGENENGPEFILLNGNGYLMEMAAYTTALKLGANVILHSVTDPIEEFPEFDKLFREMKRKGVIFINAAGNERGLVVTGTLGNEFKLNKDGYIKYKGDDIQFNCLLEDNLTDINLTWSRQEDGIVDLDFELQNHQGADLTIKTDAGDYRKNARGALTQVTEIKDPNTETMLPAEYASFKLVETKKNQSYFLKIRPKDRKATLPDGLRIRVSIQSRNKPTFQFDPNYKPVNTISITNASPSQQIAFPANLPEVFTVGSTSELSSLGPTYTGLSKPDVNLDYSTVLFNDGFTQDGSSFSAAIMAAITLVLKAQYPDLTTENLKKIAAVKFKGNAASQRVALDIRRTQQFQPNQGNKALVELHPTFNSLLNKIEQTLGKALNFENARAIGLVQEKRAVVGISDSIEKLRSIFSNSGNAEKLEKAGQLDWNNLNPHDYQFYIVQAITAQNPQQQQQFQNGQQPLSPEQLQRQRIQQQLEQQRQQQQQRPGQGQPLLRPGQNNGQYPGMQNGMPNGMQRPGQYPGMQNGMQNNGMQQPGQYPGMQNGMQNNGMQQPGQYPGMQNGMQNNGMQQPGQYPGMQNGQGQYPQLFPNMPNGIQQAGARGPSSLLEDAAQEQAQQQRVFQPIPAGTIIGIIRPKNHNNPETGSPYVQPWEIGHPNLPATAGPYLEIRQLVTDEKARALRQRDVPTDIPVWKTLPTKEEVQKILQQN